MFVVPKWLRDLGLMSWLLVGVTLLLAGSVWLLALTQTITIPVIVAGIIAAVTSPLVAWLGRHHVPRVAGAALMLIAIMAIAVGVFVMVLTGITSEASAINKNLQAGANEVQGWVEDAGVGRDTARNANDEASSAVGSGYQALIHGLGKGISKLASLTAFLAFTALSLFFLLKDGPLIRRWVERHMGVPEQLAHNVTQHTISSLRGYFLGVTVVAAFNAVVIGGGALALGVPQAGTIAAVTFLGAYIPYLGAWAAGGFAVLIALGAEGPETAAAMALIALLANGLLQQMIQPIAYGATLGIHPLAVLIVTIAGGSLFGAIGLVLAAPLTAAATRISADLGRARAEREGEGEQDAPAGSGREPPGVQPSPA